MNNFFDDLVVYFKFHFARVRIQSESSFYCLLVIQITGGEAVTTGAKGDATAGDGAIKNRGESGGIGR